MVYLVNSHTNATRIGWHLWEIDLRFAPGLPPGRWDCCKSLFELNVLIFWREATFSLAGSHRREWDLPHYTTSEEQDLRVVPSLPSSDHSHLPGEMVTRGREGDYGHSRPETEARRTANNQSRIIVAGRGGMFIQTSGNARAPLESWRRHPCCISSLVSFGRGPRFFATLWGALLPLPGRPTAASPGAVLSSSAMSPWTSSPKVTSVAREQRDAARQSRTQSSQTHITRSCMGVPAPTPPGCARARFLIEKPRTLAHQACLFSITGKIRVKISFLDRQNLYVS